MPHYACMTCKTRLRAPRMPAGIVGELCPKCSGPLEPVADLADLVGYQTIDRAGDAGGAGLAPAQLASTARLDEFILRRAERLERKRAVLAAVLGLDGEAPRADAVALVLPPPRAER